MWVASHATPPSPRDSRLKISFHSLSFPRDDAATVVVLNHIDQKYIVDPETPNLAPISCQMLLVGTTDALLKSRTLKKQKN